MIWDKNIATYRTILIIVQINFNSKKSMLRLFCCTNENKILDDNETTKIEFWIEFCMTRQGVVT